MVPGDATTSYSSGDSNSVNRRIQAPKITLPVDDGDGQSVGEKFTFNPFLRVVEERARKAFSCNQTQRNVAVGCEPFGRDIGMVRRNSRSSAAINQMIEEDFPHEFRFEDNGDSVWWPSRVAQVRRKLNPPMGVGTTIRGVRISPNRWIVRAIVSVILPLVLMLAVPTVGRADDPDPSYEFWLRFNNVTDVGKNFLEDTARGDGRVAGHHGAYTYRYGFHLPPGRNGMTPEIALVYSSQGGRSYLGEGWFLTIPFIERSTKFGVPTYDHNTDQFDYHDGNGAVHHLVPVEQDEDDIYYRYMSESEFSWFKYDLSTGLWTALLKNGNILQFGNPYSGANTYSSVRGGITAWYLNEHRDTTGNAIQYRYLDGGREQFIAPSEIVYATNVNKERIQGWEPAVRVEFEYTSGDETMLNCRTGQCYYEDVMELTSIDVKVRIGDVLIDYVSRKQFSFRYDTVDRHKVLSQIEPLASDDNGNWTTLPPISFSYSSSAPDRNFEVDTNYDDPRNKVCFAELAQTVGNAWQIKNTWQHTPSGFVTASVTSVDRTLVDMNGDSISDYVSWSHGGYRVYLGQLDESNQAVEFAPFTEWELPVVECDANPGTDEACSIRTTKTRRRDHTFVGGVGGYHAYIEFPTEAEYWGTSEIVQDLIDLNGDGRPDWIAKRCSADECWLQVSLNNGSGFDPPSNWDLPAPFFYLRGEGGTGHDVPLASLRLTLVGLVDLSGDGLPDLVSSVPFPEQGFLHVYLNTGNAFSQHPIAWSSPWGTIDLQGGSMLRAERNAGIVEIADMNGDGLSDLVVQPGFEEPPHPVNLDGVDMEPIQVYLNIGDGFEKNPRNWQLRRPLSFGVTRGSRIRDNYSDAQLIDLNADGLTDYLHYDRHNETWLFFANEGDRFASASTRIDVDGLWKERSVKGGYQDTTHSSYGKLIDINGDGRLDLVAPYMDDRSNYPSDPSCWAASLGEYTPGVKIVQVENGYGGRVAIEYTSSSVAEETFLPTPTQIVKAISEYDEFSETAQNGHTTRFSFKGGLLDTSKEKYTHPANKEFRGFATVDEFDSERNLLIERDYHQDAYRDGFLIKEDLSRLSTGEPFQTQTITYARRIIEPYPIGNTPRVQFFYPQEIQNIICNEDPECTSTIIFQRFNSDGNLTFLKDYGILQKNGQLLPGDDRRVSWGHKSRINLKNDIYIFAESYRSQSSWNEVDGKWVVDSLTSYYHDNSTSRDYVSQGLLTGVRAHNSESDYHESAYRYDSESGLLLTEADFNGNETIYTYDRVTNTFVATKKKGGLQEEYDWDIATGKNIHHRDPNKVDWYYSYDGFGRLRRESYQAPSESQTVIRQIRYHDSNYAHYGRATTLDEYATIDRDRPLSAHRRTHYNGFGKKIKGEENHDRLALNQTHNIIRYFGYDPAGRLQKVSEPAFGQASQVYSPADWAHIEHTTIQYDPLDRVTELLRPCGTNARTFSFGGDLSTTMHDEEGNKLSTLADAHGNIIEVIYYDSRGNPVKNEFRYDGHDSIIKATDSLGHEINYERDWLGRIRMARLPGLPEGKAWTFDYDGNGNLIYSLTPGDREISYIYDALDRIFYRTFRVNGTWDGSVEYNYDRPTGYGRGRLTFADSAGGLADYSYDARGNVLLYRTENGVSNNRYELAFTYNEDDEIETMTYPDGSVFRYTFNPDGTVKALIRESDGAVIAEATYDARRKIASITTDFGIWYTFSYDACGRPELVFSHNDDVIMNRSITYYQNDKIRTIRDGEEIGWGEPTEFQYDTLLRLESAFGEAYEVNYEHDVAGRLMHMDRDGRHVDFLYENNHFPWAVTSVNDSSTSTRYTYDGDGNIASARTAVGKIGFPKSTSYAFNARGLIESAIAVDTPGHVSRLAWEYDHMDRPVNAAFSGLCAWSSCPSTDYVDRYYENLGQPDVSGETTKYLFFGGRRIAALVRDKNILSLAAMPSSEQLYYFHADQLGSIRYVTDSAGELVDTHFYYPSGKEYQTAVSTKIDFGFNDRKNVGYSLYRFPLRMYNPSSHQWVSLDQTALANPFTLVLNGVNPYAYCGNDPINRHDPLGGQYSGLYDPFGGVNLYNPWSESRIMLIDPKSGAYQRMQALNHVVSAVLSEFGASLGSTVASDIVSLAGQIQRGETNESTKTALKIAAAALIAGIGKGNDPRGTEGIYQFPDQQTDDQGYVGESKNVSNRLKQHERAGKKSSSTPVIIENMPGSSKFQRNIHEENTMTEHGGLPDGRLSNQRHAIGKAREEEAKKHGLKPIPR